MAVTQPITVPVRVVADLPMAWRHQCGVLNDGAYITGAVCDGCATEARPHEVQANYLLVEVE